MMEEIDLIAQTERIGRALRRLAAVAQSLDYRANARRLQANDPGNTDRWRHFYNAQADAFIIASTSIRAALAGEVPGALTPKESECYEAIHAHYADSEVST
jgi:hypothetical protein